MRTQKSLYDKDFYAWSLQQAQHLKNKEYNMLDFDHLAEEIETLGASDQRAFKSYLARIIQHMLKCKYQPEKRTKSWERSILLYRKEAKEIFKKNPSYKRLLNDFLNTAYQMGTLEASKETKLDIDLFPEECPWTIKEVLGE